MRGASHRGKEGGSPLSGDRPGARLAVILMLMGLAENNATVMSVLLLIIGVVLIGKGIGGLSS